MNISRNKIFFIGEFIFLILVAIYCLQSFLYLLPISFIGPILRMTLLRKNLYEANFVRYWMSLFTEIGIFVLVLRLHYGMPEGTVLISRESWYLSFYIYYSVSISLLLSGFFLKRKHFDTMPLVESHFKKNTALNISCFLIYFVLLIIAWYYEIGKMGQVVEVILPFKLNGLISTARFMMPPFAFILLCGLWRRGDILFYILFCLWIAVTLLDSFFIGSKIGIQAFVAPFVFYLLLINKTIKTKVLIVGGLVLIFSFFFFRAVDISRKEGVSSFAAARIVILNPKEAFENEEGDLLTTFTRPFLRTVSYPIHHVAKFLAFNENRRTGLYDEVKEVDGAAKFNTFQIDKYPSWAIHSSGAAGLGGLYLYFGLGGLLIGWVLHLIIAIAADLNRYSWKVLFIKTVSLLVIIRLIFMGDLGDSLFSFSLANIVKLGGVILIVFLPKAFSFLIAKNNHHEDAFHYHRKSYRSL